VKVNRIRILDGCHASAFDLSVRLCALAAAESSKSVSRVCCPPPQPLLPSPLNPKRNPKDGQVSPPSHLPTLSANTLSYLASIFGTEQDKVNCSFYYKIGACRHGDRCSRKHVKPSYSQTILLPNLYQNPAYDPKNKMNPSQLQNHFDAFYEDFWCEMCKYGEPEEVVVCDNNNDRMCCPTLLAVGWLDEMLIVLLDRSHRQRLRPLQIRGLCTKSLRCAQFALVRCAPYLLRTQSCHRFPRSVL